MSTHLSPKLTHSSARATGRRTRPVAGPIARVARRLAPAAALMAAITPALAQEVALPEVRVTGEAPAAKRGYRPQVAEEGSARIHTGKKTSVATVADRPAVTDQAVRQVLAEVPGLNVSEVSNQSFVSLSFRGLGDPHESFNVQVLEEGIPISADPFGYPANYYAPPMPALESVEFFRGGSSLLFGPQPGGALNFRLRPLVPGGPARLRMQPVFGSFGYFSTHAELEAPIGDTAVRGVFHRRRSEGFRDANQDFGVNFAQLRGARWVGSTLVQARADYYDADHGEPGGLALVSSAGVRGLDQGFDQTTLLNDRLRIRRWSFNLSGETELGDGSSLANRVFVTGYDRFSRRQNLGGAPAFGGVPLATTNTIQDQDFLNVGLDSRYRRDFRDARWSVGLFGFRSGSTFDQATGPTVTSDTGSATRALERASHNLALFTEVELRAGDWRLVPGVRLEGIHQRVDETLNAATADPLRDRGEVTWVPLAGLGLERDLGETLTAYANASQGYRPVLFAESVPLAPGASISSDLRPARSLSTELGLRRRGEAALQWDTSLFWIGYNNQFGRRGWEFVNTGAARHFGLDVAANWRVTPGLLPGTWILHANATYLNARFTEGSFDGRAPQYAPRWQGRFRVEHRPGDRVRWNIGGQAASGHFGDDGNTAEQRVPGYFVADAGAEVDFARGRVTALLNLQNLLDRRYWSRVRGNGVDPAPPFTVQAGLRVTW